MKTSKKVGLALAAGLAVAGIVTYLLTSDKGKKMTKKLKEKGKGLAHDLEGMVSNAKQKFSAKKEEAASSTYGN